MPQFASQKLWTALRLIAIVSIVQALSTGAAWSLTPKQQFYRAENAYAALKKNPRHQKYRDKWLTCIDNYQKVYRLAPSGPWAAAGLYHAGLLYLEMAKVSHLSADRREAADLFQRVVQRFPKSRYTPKSKAQLAKLKQSVPAPQPSAASLKLKKAREAYQRLLADPKRQLRRDQWEACIERFRSAYAADKQGPHAAEALYMVGLSYPGLAEKSKRGIDRELAMDTFQLVKDRFPGTAFADKAREQLAAGASTPSNVPKEDDDPLAGIIARSQSAAQDSRPSAERSTNGLVSVKGLRFWSNPSYTRVVIDADQETNFSHRLLKKDPSIQKPQRLYIDLSRSRLGDDIETSVPINDKLLSDARAGQYTSDVVRVVVDIKSFKTYKIFSLKNPFRIVLDVWGLETDQDLADRSAPAVRTPAGKLPPGAIARQLALGVSRIVIDPGHGGRDYGAPGYLKGVHEKDVVLQIAKRLARKVESDLKCDAVLTRTTDRYLTLEERTAIANTQNADLFISIHTNAIRDRRAYGIETFFLNLATDDDAIRVAARENATSAKNISDLESILNDLMQNAKISESSRLAAMVQKEVCLHLKKKFSHIRNKGVKQAPFYVLLGAQMPALLIETSFISNPRECKRLTSPKYQEQLCDGIIRGIRTYIRETSPTAFQRPGPQPIEKG